MSREKAVNALPTVSTLIVEKPAMLRRYAIVDLNNQLAALAKLEQAGKRGLQLDPLESGTCGRGRTCNPPIRKVGRPSQFEHYVKLKPCSTPALYACSVSSMCRHIKGT